LLTDRSHDRLDDLGNTPEVIRNVGAFGLSIIMGNEVINGVDQYHRRKMIRDDLAICPSHLLQFPEHLRMGAWRSNMIPRQHLQRSIAAGTAELTRL
jgi:hypothetical protein